ncbi:Pentatricopeptide repeat-containing protein At2g31400 [Durusdinium trenchii]|uniref:Chloroplastic n=1 Tax=Durusdinium trenchii TaxID=1381693 RepID=A0ABP0HXL0_9DINO
MEQALLQGTAAVAEAAKQGRLEEALRRLALLRDRGLRLDAAVHHAALGGAKRRWREALQMAIQMQQDGISFTSVTFTLLLTACRPHRWRRAALLLAAAGGRASRATWNVALGLSASPDGALELLHQMRGALLRPDDVSYGAMVSSCSQSFHWMEAFQMLVMAQTNGCRLSESAFCAALACCSRSNRWVEALETLGKSTSEAGLNAAASACGKRWEMALTLLPETRGRQRRVGRNAVAAGCAQLNLWQEAFWLGMHNILPDAIGLSACFSGLEREVWPRSWNLLDDAWNKGIEVDTICGNAALSPQRTWPKAAQVLRQLQVQGLRPNSSTTATFLSQLGEHSLWEKAMSWLRDKDGESAVNAGMAACDRGGAWQHAHLLLHWPGLKVDVVGWSSCQSAQGKSGNWPGALFLLAAGSGMMLSANAVGLAAALGSCQNQWRQTLTLKRWARWASAESAERGLEVGFLARLALLSAMESASRWARSLQLWPKTAALAEEQVGEDDILGAANSLMTSCSRSACWKWALQLLSEVQSRRLPVSTIMRPLVDACEAASQPMPAVVMAQELNILKRN